MQEGPCVDPVYFENIEASTALGDAGYQVHGGPDGS